MSTREDFLVKLLQEQARFDAGESLALTRQLLAVESTAYDIKYAPRQWDKFVPADTSIDPGAESTSYTMYDRIGNAAIGGNYADDAPRVDVYLGEYTSKIFPLKAAYGYNLQELRSAALAKKPLDSMKAMAAREAIEDQIDRVAWLGDTQSGLTGMANNANVQTTSPITGTWSTAATGDQILADLNKLISDLYTNSLQVWEADSVIFSPADYMIVSQKPRSSGTDRTVLEAFLAANPSIKNVGASHRLTTAGAGSTKRVIAYKKDPQVLQLVLPVRFEALPAQVSGYEFIVPCHGRIGTVKVRYPRAMRYMDNTA